MEVHNRARDEIIREAVLEKLSEGINFFSADDILTVAGIDENQLRKISENIRFDVRFPQKGIRKTTVRKK